MSDNQVNENPNIYQIKMHRWRMAFFGVVILAAGIVIGIGLSMLLWRAPIRPFTGPEPNPGRMIQGLRHELDLSPEQRRQIEPIIRRHMERLEEIRRNARPQIMDELRRMNEEISPILDERQRQLWHRMQKRLPVRQPARPDMRFREPLRPPENEEPLRSE